MNASADFIDSNAGGDPAHTTSVQYGRPIVFGSAERPLVGRLHEPSGAVIGSVVLCSPWGYEENSAFLSFQILASRFAASHYEALRFDYDGCGNSWGDFTDSDRLQRWIASCGQAIDYMGRRSGGDVHVVGLRIGATLSVLASSCHRMGKTVLWDPVFSGSRYLRALRAMSMMGVAAGSDPADPDGLVTIGHSLSAATVAELQSINLSILDNPQIQKALVLSRPGSSEATRVNDSLTSAGIISILEEHAGTDLLMDCAAEQSVVPFNILERIIQFIADDSPNKPRNCSAVIPATATLIPPSGHEWTEEHCAVGSSGMAAVLTLPVTMLRNGVVIMVNNGVARSIGPARAWVEWARRWASLGIATMRLDFSGLGDSANRPAQTVRSQYPVEAIDDFGEAVDYLRARGLVPAIAVGLCSGAFLSVDAAANGVKLAGVIAINSQLFYTPDAPGSENRARRAAPPTHPWVQRFFENTRVGRRLDRDMPYPFWRLLARLRLLPSPLRGAAAARAKVPVMLIYGEDNLGLQRLMQRDPIGLRRWLSDGGIVTMKGLDHSMFAPQIRGKVERQVHAFLLTLLPPIEVSGAALGVSDDGAHSGGLANIEGLK